MHSTIICLVFTVIFIKNVEPKVYILDLTEPGSGENDNIKLSQILKLFNANPKSNKFQKVGITRSHHDSRHKAVVDECLALGTTQAQKFKCLRKNKQRQRQVPRFHHEYYTRQPKGTVVSLYNYYEELLKSKPNTFKDLTRQEFSQDYLDISDLSRSESCKYLDCGVDKDESYLPDRILQRNDDNKRRLLMMQRSRSDSSDSSESDKKSAEHGNKRKKTNRFQIITNDDGSQESEETESKKQSSVEDSWSKSEEFTTTTTKKPKSKKRKPKIVLSDSDSDEIPIPKKSQDKYAYLQGNKIYNDFRKRLPHFLPKRFHWDESDFKNLGYYWYDGPRGRYSHR